MTSRSRTPLLLGVKPLNSGSKRGSQNDPKSGPKKGHFGGPKVRSLTVDQKVTLSLTKNRTFGVLFDPLLDLKLPPLLDPLLTQRCMILQGIRITRLPESDPKIDPKMDRYENRTFGWCAKTALLGVF